MNDEEERIKVDAESPVAGDRPSGGISVNRRWLAILLGLVVITIIVALLVTRGARQDSLAGRPVPEPSAAVSSPGGPAPGSTGAAPRPGDLVISLDAERLSNAQITTEPVAPGEAVGVLAAGLRTTGTVQTNAYKEVPVLPIAGGIVREVGVELGDRVRRGQKIATIFSTELADAQAAYLKMLAEIERHHQHYRRTVELVELGAASREELEGATAELKMEQANLTAVKQRLILLGLSDKRIEALGKAEQAKPPLIDVEAPASGIILTRSVNTGEVVMTGKELFRVADLSSVWVVGQIYEKDFAAVRIGTPAVITTQAYPGRSFTGRVTYIDPRVEPQTRTAQVRVELVNPGERLRLGMFVDVSLGGVAVKPSSNEAAVMVPSSAVQEIAGKRVVFLAGDRPGVFIQREVTAGPESNGRAPIYSGLTAGDLVVTEGSFLLRAESLKLNPAQSARVSSPGSSSSAGGAQAETQAPESKPNLQAVTVILTERGYQPARVRLRRGVPARLTFVRKVEATCGTELLIPDYQIKRDLPFDEPVVVEFTPNKRGESEFTCGMKMLRGKIVVR
jgi:RND family efflux transporter MFP subunit